MHVDAYIKNSSSISFCYSKVQLHVADKMLVFILSDSPLVAF